MSAEDKERSLEREREWLLAMVRRIEQWVHHDKDLDLTWCVVHPDTLARLQSTTNSLLMNEGKYRIDCDKLVPLGFVDDFKADLERQRRLIKKVVG